MCFYDCLCRIEKFACTNLFGCQMQPTGTDTFPYPVACFFRQRRSARFRAAVTERYLTQGNRPRDQQMVRICKAIPIVIDVIEINQTRYGWPVCIPFLLTHVSCACPGCHHCSKCHYSPPKIGSKVFQMLGPSENYGPGDACLLLFKLARMK